MRVSLTWLTILSTLIVVSAFAQDSRATLPGYRGFNFGMSEQEARRIEKFGRVSPEKSRIRFYVKSPVIVDGVSYEMSVTFVEGKLETILMSSETPDSEVGCRYNFERVVSLLQAKYGVPDRNPANKKYGDFATMSGTTFTFRDGNSMAASQFFIKDCLVTVAYKQGKKGESF